MIINLSIFERLVFSFFKIERQNLFMNYETGELSWKKVKLF